MASRLFSDTPSNLFSPLIDVVANGMAAMFVILMVYMALFNSKPTNRIHFLDADAPAAICGIPYVFVPPVAGGNEEREFSLIDGEGKLPAGLLLDKNSGAIHGTAACIGRPPGIKKEHFSVHVRSDATDQRKVNIDIFPGAIPYDPNRKLSIQTPGGVLPTARRGVAYNVPLGAEDGAQPLYRWTISHGLLPRGLSLGASDGVIRGAPAQSGKFDFEVRLERGAGQFTYRGTQIAWAGAQQTHAYHLEVLGEGNPHVELPLAQVGDPYIGAVVLPTRAAGEDFEANSTAKGLNVGVDGLITGIPIRAGEEAVQYRLKNGNTTIAAGEEDLRILPERNKPELIGTTYYAIEAEPFSIPLAVSGLREPWKISIMEAKPWIKQDDRTIIGTAPLPGIYNIEAKVSDLFGGKARGTIRLIVIPVRRPLAIETPSLVDLPTGLARYALSASGGDGGYHWTAGAVLPSGLTISPAGVLESSVWKPGEVHLQAIVEDRSGGKQAKSVTLRFKHPQTLPLSLRTVELPPGVLNIPYHFDLAVDGAVGQVKYAVNGVLPSGISIVNGSIIGTPRQVGSWPLEIEIGDDKGQRQGPRRMILSFVSGDQSVPEIMTDQLPVAISGRPFKAVFAAEGGLGRYQWNIRGNLPPGLQRTDNGISGIPEPRVSGKWPLQVSVRDETGRDSPAQMLVLEIVDSWPDLSIATTTIPLAAKETHYTMPIIASGCWGRCSWTARGLPAGMSFTEGVLYGMPSEVGKYQLEISVEDEKQRRVSRAMTFEVAAS